MIPPRYSSSFAIHPSFFGIFLVKRTKLFKKKQNILPIPMTSGKKDWPPNFPSGGNPPTDWLHVFHAFDRAFFFQKKKHPHLFWCLDFSRIGIVIPVNCSDFYQWKRIQANYFWMHLKIHPAFGEKNPTANSWGPAFLHLTIPSISKWL